MTNEIGEDSRIAARFASALWGDVPPDHTFPERRPLLAHYTSIATLERIMTSDELWFSHPLYMNDMEELRFGIFEGAAAFRLSDDLRSACGTETRYRIVRDAFERHFALFDQDHAFDIYVFCLSEYRETDLDGLLSMWRGYGGNGTGAAIVFDTAKINFVQDAPLIISKVDYASQVTRRARLRDKVSEFARLLRAESVADQKLDLAVRIFFERLKAFALLTKHDGFTEECEWRAVYLRDRDVKHRLDGMIDYATGRTGIEPKLKFRVAPIVGYTADDLSLEKIVHRILLGPSHATPLAVSTVRRMLRKAGKSRLAETVVASTTPFRAN